MDLLMEKKIWLYVRFFEETLAKAAPPSQWAYRSRIDINQKYSAMQLLKIVSDNMGINVTTRVYKKPAVAI